MRVIMLKKEAHQIHAGLTQTTKMPCKSYSLPTEACRTGFKLSKIAGTICSVCYANKGNYKLYENNIKPAQFARLDALSDPYWVDAMVTSIGADEYFRWHDSGDLQGLWHLEKIVEVALKTPDCMHWLPTREYGIVKDFIAKYGDAIPKNLIIRLSAMYVDKPVIIPVSLQGKTNITASNVHTEKSIGVQCNAPSTNGECRDCRTCWTTEVVSYSVH